MGERLHELEIFAGMDVLVRDEPESPTVSAERIAPVRCAKRELDQFYTRPKIAAQCMTLVAAAVAKHVDGVVGTWLEPSAGKGAFLNLMPSPRLGLDLDPAHGDVIEQNFLTWDGGENLPGPVVTVGNPPFGKNASLALKFVNRAAKFSDLVCMILPRTFEKHAMQAKVVNTHELLENHTLDPDSFSFDGVDYAVPCCFQIWKRLAKGKRIAQPTMLTHHHFEFVDNQGLQPEVEHAARLGVDFAFQRVGGRAGHASVEGLSKSWKSHYWIKANTEFVTPADLMTRLNLIDWDEHKHRTAGNPSIGKGELVLEYAKLFPHLAPMQGSLGI
jgi:predicted RNA methylase